MQTETAGRVVGLVHRPPVQARNGDVGLEELEKGV